MRRICGTPRHKGRCHLIHVVGFLMRSTTLVARTQTRNRKYGKNQIALSGAAPARNSPIPITSAGHPSQGGSARVERAARPEAARKAAIADQLTTKIPFDRPNRMLAPVVSRSARLNVWAIANANSASPRTMKMPAASKTRVDAAFDRSSATRNLTVRTAANTAIRIDQELLPTKAQTADLPPTLRRPGKRSKERRKGVLGWHGTAASTQSELLTKRKTQCRPRPPPESRTRGCLPFRWPV